VGLLMEAFLIAFVTLRGFPVSVTIHHHRLGLWGPRRCDGSGSGQDCPESADPGRRGS
jgi:hypothetical protein